jgi:hypothetical protein
MLVARNVFAAGADFEASYRVVAYASAPLALMWLPLVGSWTFLYTIFLVIVGLERVNGFDAVKSVLTVVLASVVVMVISWTFGLHPHPMGTMGYYHHGLFMGCHN